MDEAITITDREAFQMARRLTREEGMLVGGAAGCAVAAALRYGSRPENAGKDDCGAAARYRPQLPVQNLQRRLDARQRFARIRLNCP